MCYATVTMLIAPQAELIGAIVQGAFGGGLNPANGYIGSHYCGILDAPQDASHERCH